MMQAPAEVFNLHAGPGEGVADATQSTGCWIGPQGWTQRLAGARAILLAGNHEDPPLGFPMELRSPVAPSRIYPLEI